LHMSDTLRPCWQNCFIPDDERALRDEELAAIDAMEDSISPLDDDAVSIRRLITCFESCYHEADRQAELIIKAIGTGRPQAESAGRPPGRKRDLQNCHMRKCARQKGFENCAYCNEYTCERIEKFFAKDPDARARLDAIRSEL